MRGKLAWRWVLVAVVLGGPPTRDMWAEGKEAGREQIYQFLLRDLGSKADSLTRRFEAKDLEIGGEFPKTDEPLELVSVRWDRLLARWEFRLRCRDVGKCVPFMATAKRAGMSPGIDGDSAVGSADQEGQRITRRDVHGSVLIRAGQRATVTRKDGSLQIRVEVVCLERGGLGQWIRVRMNDGHARVFRARVTGEGLLAVEGVTQ